MAGAIADFSSFSFHAVKNFTTAEGGALTWNIPFGHEPVKIDAESFIPVVEGETWNEYLYRLSQLFSLHGQNKDALAKTKVGAWEYDIIAPFYKCNMTDVMAGIGLAQTGDGAKLAGEYFVRSGEFVAGITAELDGLFLHGFVF